MYAPLFFSPLAPVDTMRPSVCSSEALRSILEQPFEANVGYITEFFLQSQPPPACFGFFFPSTIAAANADSHPRSWQCTDGFQPQRRSSVNLFTLASTLGKSCARDRVRDTSPRTKPPQATSVCLLFPPPAPSSPAERKSNTASTNSSLTPH